MILFDTTKTGAARHRSGLTRVSRRLAQELGDAAAPVTWSQWGRAGADDWVLTAELFSEPERPGLTDFLRDRRCRAAAIFHDAIPLKLPRITWPHSVARHPGYMKLLASFDLVWAVSEASRRELEGFWCWQGLGRTPPVEVLPLGADFARTPRAAAVRPPEGRPRLLCLGILEPRKNQLFLLDVCERLWREGLDFELHLAGRANPHFGAPVVARLKALRRASGARVCWHEAPDDAALARLFATARATVFPTLAEGCGLPLLESLWMGTPCVCSDLPVLRENADGGGCVSVPVNDTGAWAAALRRMVTDEAGVAALFGEVAGRSLPTWADTAATIRARLRTRARL